MLEKMKKITLEAAKLFKEGYNDKKQINHKGVKDLVTNYDIAVEKFLIKEISKEFSDFYIIAEESKNDLELLDNLIIIDPIDGTSNFIKEIPYCCISIGVYKNKKPYIALVYNPILNELYTAQAKKGAYLNGVKIEVSSINTLQSSLIGTGFPYTSSHNKSDLNFVINTLKNILPKCQDIRRMGSASLDLCMVAQGKYEAYYEINTNAWDVAAGILIVLEAGGKISNNYNKEYNIFKDKCIVATNNKVHSQVIDELTNL